jgi:predicted metalloprotease with PDZ domain
MLQERGKGINDLLNLLWKSYKDRPEKGLSTEEVFSMVKSLGGQETSDVFEDMVTTTKDIDFDFYFQKIGLRFKWDEPKSPYLGAEFDFKEDRVFVKTVLLDSPAYRGGLNAGDEIISMNGLRLLKADMGDLTKLVQINVNYEFLVSRLDKITPLTVLIEEAPRALKEIQITDREKALKALGVI